MVIHLFASRATLEFYQEVTFGDKRLEELVS